MLPRPMLKIVRAGGRPGAPDESLWLARWPAVAAQRHQTALRLPLGVCRRRSASSCVPLVACTGLSVWPGTPGGILLAVQPLQCMGPGTARRPLGRSRCVHASQCCVC